jgi:hypothetical protein
MTIAKTLFLAAAVLFLLAAIGSTLLPNAMIWALVCIALGLFLSGYDLNFKTQ